MTDGDTSLGTVLVVDDELDAAEAIAEALHLLGYRALCETDPEEAVRTAMRTELDVVLTDLRMRGIGGLGLCERLTSTRPELPVIVVTGHASVDAAVGALRVGAFDFVIKPVNAEMLAGVVSRAVERRRLASEVHRLRSELERATKRSPLLLGTSDAMQRRVLDVVERIAPTQATVLVQGESGTGKELVARAIHAHSARASGPFVAVNCAAVPATLFESELFGHAKGAFTDAKSARRGLFLDAQGGTLFLDEIGEMPLEMQVKVLRALQERTVRPVGGGAEVAFDARLVAATNRDLEREVQQRRFREDLYYRINVCTVAVPPLRDRDGDIPVLARAFVERFAARHGKTIKGISAPALAKLMAYRWPGNVRELENSIERAVAMAEHDQVTVDDLPERVRAHRPSAAPAPLPTPDELVTLEEIERRHIEHVLGRVKGNKSKAARVLGCDRRTLYRKLAAQEPLPVGDTAGSPSSAPRSASPPPDSSSMPSSTAPSDGPRILVVDDDPGNLAAVEILLAAKGYRVTTATGVAEAMRTRHVDAVLTDLDLGDGSGADLVGRFGDAPVMVMAGAPPSDENLGFDAWLGKPVSLDRLTQTIASVVG